MCGVVGLFQSIGTNPRACGLIHRMADAIRHRGPDGEGFYTEPGITLGHRRLAIVDISGGVQPMATPDGALVVSFNGEIYNHQSLRRDLEKLGHQFQTRSDTESLLHGWRAWGVSMLDRLNGMFAFALWDREQGSLLLARDRLGEKPLYYTTLPDGTVAFASEMAGLLALPELPTQIDPAALDDFLALGYVPDPQTVYRGIHRLSAAHFLLLRRGSKETPTPRRYWELPTAAEAAPSDAAAELLTRLDTSVRARLMADVPLGAFLSGGVDSGAVVALAACGRKAPLETFTIGFPGSSDERTEAACVAAYVGAKHHAEEGSTDYVGAARRQALLFGEPFGDHSAVPTLAVSALARRHVTVALTGDGGDEVFAGYRRYRFHALAEAVRTHVPARLRRNVIGGLATMYPKLDRAPRWLRAKHTLTEISLDSALGYYRTVCKLQTDRRRALFSASMRVALDGHDAAARFKTLMTQCDPDDPLLAAQYADLHTYLPGDILVKVDRASMAVSLEVRPPLLDPDLVAWGLALPARAKLQGNHGKYVLRQAMKKHLPEPLLWRRKTGFAASIAQEFRARSAEIHARLLAEPMLDAGLFDATSVGRMVEEHASGHFDHAQALWQLLVLEGFLATGSGAIAPGMQREQAA